MASLMSVNEPLIRAWLAIMVARVAMMTHGIRKKWGTMA